MGRTVPVNIEVIEFELTCAEHGVHRVLVPVELPRPRACAHCYLPAERKELRRFAMAHPLPAAFGGEAFIG
jgi:hypothetical protein